MDFIKRFDLHTHTKYSPRDGLLEPRDVVKLAKKRGLDGLAVTDHNTIKGGLRSREFAGKDFELIVGSEIRTTKGEIIGLYLSEEISTKDPDEVITRIKEQNGIAIIPHPFDDLRKSALQPEDHDVKRVDAIEVFNSRCVFQKYNDRANDFAVKHKKGISAGSDGHFANEIGIAGVIIETEELRDALIKGKVEVFGKRSSFLNHGFTKVLKLWRRIRYGL